MTRKKTKRRDLERRISELEAEVAILREQAKTPTIRSTPPTSKVVPLRQWWQDPWICTAATQVIKTDPNIKTYTWN